VAEVTSTLHLHAWVNKADHPMGNARSFELADIIDALKAGKTVGDMVLQRNNGVYHVPANDAVSSIEGAQ